MLMLLLIVQIDNRVSIRMLLILTRFFLPTASLGWSTFMNHSRTLSLAKHSSSTIHANSDEATTCTFGNINRTASTRHRLSS